MRLETPTDPDAVPLRGPAAGLPRGDPDVRCGAAGTGLRSTRRSLLRLLDRVGEVRQVDLGAMASLDETTLTRNLRPLGKSGWLTIRARVRSPGEAGRDHRGGENDGGRGPPGLVEGPDRMKNVLRDGMWDFASRRWRM